MPLELEDHGINEIWNGVIFGAYALSGIVNSLIIPDLCQGYDRKSVIILGLTLMGSSITLFGLVIYLPDTWMIITASIILRIIQGCAASLMKIMGYSIVLIVYPDEKIKYLGIMESGMGVGMATGPLIGSGLYKLTKFTPTFLLIGGIIYLFTIAMYIFTPSIKLEEKQQVLKQNENIEEKGLL